MIHKAQFTVHSVTSNTLRDAQKLCILRNFARLGIFVTFAHKKTARGILPVNTNRTNIYSRQLAQRSCISIVNMVKSAI